MADEINDTNEPIDDVVFEATAEGEGESLSKDKIKKLRDELKESKLKEMEYLTAWQRERADFQNYKKDETERTSSMSRRATEKFVEDLLPILDSYDMAFQNREAWEKVDPTWRSGVEYIHQQLLGMLASYGVTELAVKVGHQFDPNQHEPIETIPTDDSAKDNTIERIIQKGYILNSKLLRPARVKVWGSQ